MEGNEGGGGGERGNVPRTGVATNGETILTTMTISARRRNFSRLNVNDGSATIFQIRPQDNEKYLNKQSSMIFPPDTTV